MEGRGRPLLVNTEGLVLKVRAHSTRVLDAYGIRLLLNPVRAHFGRLSHVWVDVGYQGRGKRWAEEVMGLSVEVVRKPPKPVPEEVAEGAGCGEDLLLAKGVHPKIVQKLLGHSSISITLDTYSHVLPNMQEKAVEAMEDVLRDD